MFSFGIVTVFVFYTGTKVEGCYAKLLHREEIIQRRAFWSGISTIKLYLVEYSFIYQLTATSFMYLSFASESSLLHLFAGHEILEFYFHYKESIEKRSFVTFTSIQFISLRIEPFIYNISYFGCDNIRKSVIIAAILLFPSYITLDIINYFTSHPWYT